ncbi:scaffoldin [Anaeromyces robustus]|uniref:Scaffoldin n=1 Tax=Anaeromyces robustus TaxID=1754192 RepID=A0A1Y1XEA5_9FUNG|nr:scaffoldin [Anaeromyces robustus]|eukprot:ORX84090.1 scaffoldin [Anaeromyces robustus]
MKTKNHYKILFIIYVILHIKKILATVPSCTYNSNQCSTNNESQLEKDYLCYDENTKYFYLMGNGNSCTLQQYSGNIFLNCNDSKCKLIKSETDSIEEGYNCKVGKCNKITVTGLYDNVSNPEYYIYYDDQKKNFQQLKIINYAVYLINSTSLVTCMGNKLCKINTISANGYYVNSGNNESGKLISCLTKDSTIVCQNKQINEGYFLNSGPDKSSKPLIHCISSVCNTEVINGNNYFLNAGSLNSNMDSLIYCSDVTCTTIITANNQFYIGYNNDSNMLISCNDKGCSIINSVSDKGYYKNSGENNNLMPLIHCNSYDNCSGVSITEPGYYIDASTTNHVFFCSDTCSSVDVKTIDATIPGKCTIIDNYFVMIGNYNEKDNNYDILYTSNEDLYYYLEITPESKFPSIISTVKTLFKISSYSITRVVVDGIISINDNSHRINNQSANLTNGDSLFKCTKSKMICEKEDTCSTGSFYLDVNNKIGYRCNSNKLNVISKGYYLDSNKMNGSYHPYLIYCKAVNDCTYVTNPSDYYINSGHDNNSSKFDTDILIYCNNNSCKPVPCTSNSYYIAGNSDIINNEYIYCSSSTQCEYKKSLSESYYINSGQDKNKKALIKCVNGKCQSINANNGYYINDKSDELIYCDSGNNCSIIKASSGFYYTNNDTDGIKKIIECTTKTNVSCEKKKANNGYYISNTSNILIDCMSDKCKTIYATNGIFRSATTTTTTTTTMNYKKRNSSIHERDTQVVYNIISCTNTGCHQLSASELAAIPVCTFERNKCFITTKYSINPSAVSSIKAGEYCTNLDHSIIYFATDTVVTDPEIIDGTTSIYTTTTTTTNCIEVTSEYSSYYYTVNGNIYRINDGRITQETQSGYYFINIETNTLVNGNTIEEYNNPNCKLFKCNDSSCNIVEKPNTTTYYADVNKKIIKFDINNNLYTFPYDKDIVCIYNNNKCTPKYDLKNQEFCITYTGELVLASSDIKSHETGDCYKSNNIISYIFGYSQHLYEMDSNSAQLIDTAGYYIVSMATNSTASYKDYNNSNNNIIKIYGCLNSSCKEYEPIEGIYYYDYLSRYMYKYEDGVWSTPKISGYVFASIIPNDIYIYRFSINMNNKVLLEGKAVSGYYYTVDNEMYDCDENYGCEKISDNGYYFTNNGEMYYCLYDSEELEKTTCVKQNCYIGEYYFIDGIYYRCEFGSIYNYISGKYCNYNERVIVNFPVAINTDYPSEVYEAITKISKNNNSTAIINNKINNYLTVIPGIYTNCTYNYEDKTSSFDLLCINNFVTLDDDDNAQICSISQLGYVECVEDESNKEKCNPSLSFARYSSNITYIITISIIYLILEIFYY